MRINKKLQTTHVAAPQNKVSYYFLYPYFIATIYKGLPRPDTIIRSPPLVAHRFTTMNARHYDDDDPYGNGTMTDCGPTPMATGTTPTATDTFATSSTALAKAIGTGIIKCLLY